MTGHGPAIGCAGTIVLGTRGAGGPGEVLLQVAGGTEVYVAYSDEPLIQGTPVLVYNVRGGRVVDVMKSPAQHGP